MLTDAHCTRFLIVGRQPTTKKTSIERLRLRLPAGAWSPDIALESQSSLPRGAYSPTIA
jgi:hypothetical protein